MWSKFDLNSQAWEPRTRIRTGAGENREVHMNSIAVSSCHWASRAALFQICVKRKILPLVLLLETLQQLQLLQINTQIFMRYFLPNTHQYLLFVEIWFHFLQLFNNIEVGVEKNIHNRSIHLDFF